jgi:hypothetical protein
MSLFADTGLPTMIALGAVVLLVGMMLLRLQRYYGRRPSSTSPVSPSPAPRHPSPVTREMAELEVQMHDLAREMSGQLTSKMAALEHLIRDADRAAARLEAALTASRQKETPAPALGGTGILPVFPTCTGETPVPPGVPPPASQADALKPAADRFAERPSRQRRHEEVYTLADYGYDAAEIAQRVGTPVGEIELILSLRGSR